MHTILLDGYNVILRSPAFRPGERRNLAAARTKLVNLLTWAVGSVGEVEFILVFDGADVPGAARRQSTGSQRVQVRFSEPPQKADDLIKLLVEEWTDFREEVTVVTSDLEIAQHARAHGANLVLSDLFAASLFPERAEAQLKKVLAEAAQGGKAAKGGPGASGRGAARGKAAGRSRAGTAPRRATGSPTAEGSDAEAKPPGMSKKQAAEWLRMFEEQRRKGEPDA